MTIRKGSTIIAGVATNTKSNSNTLLSFKWSDHIINSMEWLRSDTFSWQSGSVYVAAYNHLTADISTATQSTETIAGTTITVYTATDGHKIVLADQESAVSAIYSATGVAWYYIVDTANTRFKLPRTQYGFDGIRDTVGKYIPESLPNIKGNLVSIDSNTSWNYTNGAFKESTVWNSGVNGGTLDLYGPVSFDASRSSSTYQDNAPVQPKATQMYLYFYVGEYSQSATEQTAGITTEQLNGKVDVASLSECHVVVETYQNGTSWYRLYDDGWVEQGGLTPSGADQTTQTVTLLKEMENSNYFVSAVQRDGPSGSYTNGIRILTYTTTSFQINYRTAGTTVCYWEVKGY